MSINDIIKVPYQRNVKVTKATASLLQRQRRRIQAQQSRRWMERVLYLLWIACGAIATHKLLSVVTNTHSPLLVALSGGMKNLPDRGDVLLINNSTVKVGIGDDAVFLVEGRDGPLFHRIMKVHEDAQTGQVDFLSKGDDNGVDDRGFYAPGQRWLHRDYILGNVVVYLRTVGILEITMLDYPVFGWVLFGVVGRSIVFGAQPIFGGRPNRSSIMFYLLALSSLLKGCTT